MPNPAPLRFDCYYHIFNRGVNRQKIFLEERNYRYFLNLYAHHIEPVADTYAYCLLPNHFHLLIRTKTETEQLAFWEVNKNERTTNTLQHPEVVPPSQQFSNLFNAYTKAINKTYGRTGSLFERPFHRIEATTDDYFDHLVVYIHQNAQKHGLVDDFRTWPFSSYQTLRSTHPTRLKRDTVIGWFGGLAQVDTAHQNTNNLSNLKHWFLEDIETNIET